MRLPPFSLSGWFFLIAMLASSGTAAEPLSKDLPLDFYRDVASRNLKGLAARADGRLVAGPSLTELTGLIGADLLWCMEPVAAGRWAIGADGKILEVTIDAGRASFSSRVIASVDEPQVFALKRLRDGSLLAGTSPRGALLLIQDGRVVARVAAPVDSIFDLVLLDDATVLAATGNPGRIYKIDLKKFAAAGVAGEKISDEKLLASKGVTLFGTIHDRNIRRLAVQGDRVVAGSSPKGNIYSFPRSGGEPVMLQENREAEVPALLPQADGSLFAAIVFSNTQGESRINRAVSAKLAPEQDLPPPAATERFPGRSTLLFFPKEGFPEPVASRAGMAFYALIRHADTLVIGGGELGDLLGVDLKTRQSLSFAGSVSSQLNQIVPIPEATGRFLVLHNNAPGLALLDFASSSDRAAETKRIDLGTPATLGALRFEFVRGFDPAKATISLRTSLSADEAEGWSPWQPAVWREDGWLASGARGRYVKFRLALPATENVAVDHATLYFLPQNHRPTLNEFRLISPNFALLPPAEPSSPPVTTLARLIGADPDRDDKRKAGLLGSNIVPLPGAQVALWNITDADGDTLACTFSIRREGSDTWTDLALDNREGYVQFDLSHLKEGTYSTKLVATEQAPRPTADRLSVTFETDDLVVDKTPPAIANAGVSRDADTFVITVSGRDAVNLLAGAEFVFNNGHRDDVSQPADGIRDSKVETFALRVPSARIFGATSVEIILSDAASNTSAQRLEIK